MVEVTNKETGDFNSHARVGRDISANYNKLYQTVFQLTRPCRA